MKPITVQQLSEGSSVGVGGIVSVVTEIVQGFSRHNKIYQKSYFHEDRFPHLRFSRRIGNKISRSIVNGEQPFRLCGIRVPDPDLDLSKIDILHVHKPTFFDYCCRVKRMFPDIQIIVHAHSVDGFTGGCILENDCKELENGCTACPVVRKGCRRIPAVGMKRRTRQFAEMSPTVIANSQFTRQSIMRSPLSKHAVAVHVVTPGIRRIQGFSPKARPSDRLPTIGFAAASLAEPNKQFGHFLEVIERMNAAGVEVQGLAAGQPPLGSHDASIKFAGSLSAAELFSFYEAIDVLIVCSKSESFGKVSIEAQVCGTPVVAYGVGGLPETILEGITGRVVPPNDRTALFDSVHEIVCRRAEYRDRLRSNDATKFLTQFSNDSITEKYADIYQEAYSRNETKRNETKLTE